MATGLYSYNCNNYVTTDMNKTISFKGGTKKQIWNTVSKSLTKKHPTEKKHKTLVNKKVTVMDYWILPTLTNVRQTWAFTKNEEIHIKKR